ncbi:MAG: DUF2129 domain-containing protein [Acholeplasmataceae bacterium]|nr:DUF2129 domain-containing protein [Acholeplasmataceae bacterium]MDD4203855.1 DUF2129 domain-containing protein [Acholeplasmataceae bacterium]MDD4468376.1 DUF2129 domain-containing protein [Acholeplasmataceae bacterium]MDD4823668.1 DUF2129 domain-containing protein [Acholeplasmataceae bacterium]
MQLDRISYLVYFRHKSDIKKIKKIENIDIYYTSLKSKYLTVYLDKVNEKQVKQALSKTKGVKSFEPSLLDRPEINIEF